MSRSTITFGPYSLTAGTPVVEIVCGFLLKTFSEDSSLKRQSIIEMIAEMQEYMDNDHGFVRIELPNLMSDDMNALISAVSRCISRIQSHGTVIPLQEVLIIQREGFLLKEDRYIHDLPTKYILDYFNQLKKMLTLPTRCDLDKENEAAIYAIREI